MRIEGFDCLVFEDGRVFSFQRNIFLAQKLDRYGYWIVRISKNKVRKSIKVHRIVAMAFLDNPNNYPIVNHKDGNKENNHTSNLEWCTVKQNNQHAVDIGLRTKFNNNCKLSEADLPKIIKRHESGESQLLIAKSYGVSQGAISNIITGRAWRK